MSYILDQILAVYINQKVKEKLKFIKEDMIEEIDNLRLGITDRNKLISIIEKER